MGLANAFESSILPIFFDFGKCLFYVSIISGVYMLIRGNGSESIKKIKTSIIGYVAMRCTIAFVNLVDRIADTIKF